MAKAKAPRITTPIIGADGTPINIGDKIIITNSKGDMSFGYGKRARLRNLPSSQDGRHVNLAYSDAGA